MSFVTAAPSYEGRLPFGAEFAESTYPVLSAEILAAPRMRQQIGLTMQPVAHPLMGDGAGPAAGLPIREAAIVILDFDENALHDHVRARRHMALLA